LVAHATGFTSIELEAVDVPDPVDGITAALLAEGLEGLALEAPSAQRTFDWKDGRPSRALWCGVPPIGGGASNAPLVALGQVAGVAMALADSGNSTLLALSTSPEVALLLNDFASANDRRVAEELVTRGGALIQVDGSRPVDAINEARIRLHEFVRVSR